MAGTEETEVNEEVENQEAGELKEGSEQETLDEAIKETEETLTDTERAGFVRDLQAERTERQRAQADAAASQQEVRDLTEQLKSTSKEELDEEQLEEPVSKRELRDFSKQLTESLTNVIEKRSTQDNAKTLAKSQGATAERLAEDYTVKKAGEGLDAETVCVATKMHLQQNDPETLEALQKSARWPANLYNYGIAEIPRFQKLSAARRNTKLADQLDQTGEEPPSGAGKGGGADITDGDALLEAVMAGDITDEKMEEMGM